MSFLDEDDKSDLSVASFHDDQSILGEDDLLPLSKDTNAPKTAQKNAMLSENVDNKVTIGLPSPGTFFASLSGQLGSLEGRADERNRVSLA